MGDIALFFVNPATAGTKVAALVGRGAKVAKAVSTGIKVVRHAKQGKSYKNIPDPVMDKLGALEILSLGYWGEKLGMMMGGGPTEEMVLDHEVHAEQTRAIAELDAAILKLRQDLQCKEGLESQQQLTGWALEQNKQGQARLQTEILQLQQKAEQLAHEAQLATATEHRQAIKRYAGRAVEHWLHGFEQQGASMVAVLGERAREYWESHVDESLKERVAGMDELATSLHAAPQEKAERLAVLRAEADALTATLEVLA
jgi:hypothetical protein